MMRYIGIDYGAKRIGIAVSDEKGQFAFPRETVPNDTSVIDRIAKIIHRDGVGEIVMGDTRADTGAENLITKDADDFVEQLTAHTGFLVHRSREAWSSLEAARFAPKGKEHDDAAAAAIILQRFLDSRGT